MELSEKDVARFWSKVDRRGPDDCWPWGGWSNAFGHGRFDVKSQKLLAHRVALVAAGRPVPAKPNDCALHGDCSNPACCNPAHLRWGSKAENTHDRDRLGRGDWSGNLGEKNSNARLTADAVREIRSSDKTQRELAKIFGVSQVAISKVVRGLHWRHVT